MGRKEAFALPLERITLRLGLLQGWLACFAVAHQDVGTHLLMYDVRSMYAAVRLLVHRACWWRPICMSYQAYGSQQSPPDSVGGVKFSQDALRICREAILINHKTCRLSCRYEPKIILNRERQDSPRKNLQPLQCLSFLRHPPHDDSKDIFWLSLFRRRHRPVFAIAYSGPVLVPPTKSNTSYGSPGRHSLHFARLSNLVCFEENTLHGVHACQVGLVPRGLARDLIPHL